MTYISLPQDLDLDDFPKLKEAGDLEEALHKLYAAKPSELMDTWRALKKTMKKPLWINDDYIDGDEQ